MMNFEVFFRQITSHVKPHQWQIELTSADDCTNRLIRIPTGFGKTHGVLAAWIWHRLIHARNDWPHRLVWCLPMRVLVEQTEEEVRKALTALGLLWEGGDHDGKVGVHLLMGGAESGEWHLYPEQCAVLIGTQDMLLSRAMNRGYASPRARWPMEFGLLNQDVLWVMDEVQLMDVGLATSGQLQAFRDDDSRAGRSMLPCFTWWMSATLQKDWLAKSPETASMTPGLPPTEIPASERNGHLWDDTSKPCRIHTIKDAKELAELVAREHDESGRGTYGPTLVVLNTVERAVMVYKALHGDKALKGTDLRLIHSRFRPSERISWRGDFLNRNACAAGTDRIIVATQVIEAGVDISAGVLITELAPWTSLVQRFGRCARWGGKAQVIVADLNPKDDKEAAPYSKDEIDSAREALEYQCDVAPLSLETFEENHPQLLSRLYPYEPRHLLLRHELDELFDTTPDLSGADIDISRFIRSGEERDLHVFWAEVPEKTDPPHDLRPSREALCAVPFLKARDWLCGKESGNKKAPRLKSEMRAWVWDWLDGIWRRAERRDLYPGQTVLVASECGGYDYNDETKTGTGWCPDSGEFVKPVPLTSIPADELADSAQDDESLSELSCWKSIATHGRETGALARRIVEGLAPMLSDLLDLAGRWHDAGKGHDAFQSSIKEDSGKPRGILLAKAPKEAWRKGKQLYRMKNGDRRPGFRHELASVLSLFSVLQRHQQDHPALLGPWRELLEKAGMRTDNPSNNRQSPNPLEAEILALDADQFALLAYLVCAHHGKVRLAWHACPADQTAADETLRIRGVRDGDTLPTLPLTDRDHSLQELTDTRLDLSPAAAGLNPRTGPGWTERVLRLLEVHGPFALAWMEALFRAADQRASALDVRDELINPEVSP